MSEIRATTVSDINGTGPVALTKQNASKMWINFNGTGTVAIRDGLNTSSVTDNGTGDYTIVVSNAFSNTDYALAGASGGGSSGYFFRDYSDASARTSTQNRVIHVNTAGTPGDPVQANYNIHGDLA